MNKTVKMKVILTLAACVALAGIVRAEKDEEVKLADLPAAVKAAVESAIAGATIKKIEKGDEDGKSIYEVEFTKNGKDAEATISPDGKLMNIEEASSLEAAPEAVQKAIKEKAGSDKVVAVEKITADGKVTFEAVIAHGKKKIEYVFADDGKFISKEDVTDEKD